MVTRPGRRGWRRVVPGMALTSEGVNRENYLANLRSSEQSFISLGDVARRRDVKVMLFAVVTRFRGY